MFLRATEGVCPEGQQLLNASVIHRRRCNRGRFNASKAPPVLDVKHGAPTPKIIVSTSLKITDSAVATGT